MDRIHGLRTASRGFESQKAAFDFLFLYTVCAQRAWVQILEKSMVVAERACYLNSLLSFNKVSLLTKLHDPAQGLIIISLTVIPM